MSTPDILAALLKEVHDTVHVSVNRHEWEAAFLRARGVVVIPTDPSEAMIDAAAEALGYPRDNSSSTELGGPDNRHLERVREVLRAALAVLKGETK